MILTTAFLLSCVAALALAELHHTRTLHGDYDLDWGVLNNTLEVKIKVKTTGWVAFGVSPNGGMPGADIVMAWIDADGTPHFSDRHVGAQSALPTVDAKQSYELLELSETSGSTTLHFRRPLNTCDDNDFLLRGTARVIYAFGENKPVGGIPEKHLSANRGTKSLDLLQGEAPPAEVAEQDAVNIDMVFDNVQIPGGDQTRYWWKLMKWPTDKKVHMIRADPIIPAGEELAMHHILVYACKNNVAIHDGFVGNGYDGEAPKEVQGCNFVSPITAWAVGGVGHGFPADVGMPLGEDDSSKYLLMEVHYDLPDKLPHVTNGGIRLTYTETLRPIDAGILTTGANVDSFLAIPPLDEPSRRVGVCGSECTKSSIPTEGVNVIASMLHMHTSGVGMVAQHIREDGTELEPMAINEHYDFNLQTIVFKEKPRKLMPGDTVRTTCIFNGKGRDGVTIGGLATKDEMCLTYLIYYPRIDLSLCLSTGSAALVSQLATGGAFGDVTQFGQPDRDYWSKLLTTDDWTNMNAQWDLAMKSDEKLLTQVCDNNYFPITSEAPKIAYVEPRNCPLETTAAPTTTTTTTTKAATTTTVVVETATAAPATTTDGVTTTAPAAPTTTDGVTTTADGVTTTADGVTTTTDGVTTTADGVTTTVDGVTTTGGDASTTDDEVDSASTFFVSASTLLACAYFLL